MHQVSSGPHPTPTPNPPHKATAATDTYEDPAFLLYVAVSFTAGAALPEYVFPVVDYIAVKMLLEKNNY